MSAMPFYDLEKAYDMLADGIDTAGRAHEALFLTKLALVLAREVGDIEIFRKSVAMALMDLPKHDAEVVT
jgi:hypothetical protein